ncbi:MAG TPA: hypothetical protein VNI84_11935 [Pyrinomonadaceae bacterium]|nr:hypothetical protein [Pyrinomonadaceae bacterium]
MKKKEQSFVQKNQKKKGCRYFKPTAFFFADINQKYSIFTPRLVSFAAPRMFGKRIAAGGE